MLTRIIQYNSGFTVHKFCNLLGLAFPFLSSSIIDLDTETIYKLSASVALNIEYEASLKEDPILFGQFTLGRQRAAMAKAARGATKRARQNDAKAPAEENNNTKSKKSKT